MVDNPAKFGRIDPKDWANYPEHYTVSLWPANLPSSPKDYGDNQFHGRTHPEIIITMMNRYTKPGDLVYDPFAGSGTTIDVCKELDNKVIATDINPYRDDIIKADARLWQSWMAEDEVDLAVVHPPYMGIVDYGEEGGLCTYNLNQYLKSMDDVLRNISRLLKSGRVCVLIVGMLYADVGDGYKQVVCLDMELFPTLMHYGFRLLGRIIREFGETKGGATAGKKNENLWRYRRLRYGLWSLEYDVVLVLQKVE